MPEELPSKIHTGSLLDNLDEATRAEVLGLRCMRHPLVEATKLYPKIIQETLIKCSYFDVLEGKFIRDRLTQGSKSLGPLGCIYSEGYVKIRIKTTKFNQSHLVYLWLTGDLPLLDEQMDHIDGNNTNDYPGNLRLVASKLNQRNKKMQRNNTSGYTGISWQKSSSKWRAYVKIDSKLINLGSFYTFEIALAARQGYLQAHPELGFTIRHGL